MLTDLFNLFFPKTCVCCDDLLINQEEVVCLSCRHQLPLTHSHKNNENTVKKVFYGRVPVINAVSLFYFYKKGITQALLHQLKYKGQENVSAFLGNWLAAEMEDTEWVNQLDVVIPVPLHRKRLRKRGYNQVEGFGKSLAIHFNAEYVDDVLIKNAPSRTQVFKNRIARAEIKDDDFGLQNTEKVKDKHILLVDDIVTTGATLETCANILLQIPRTKISIATMAIAV